eukprot:1158004-Pelagomonas_calceolata.AAC.7
MDGSEPATLGRGQQQACNSGQPWALWASKARLLDNDYSKCRGEQQVCNSGQLWASKARLPDNDYVKCRGEQQVCNPGQLWAGKARLPDNDYFKCRGEQHVCNSGPLRLLHSCGISIKTKDNVGCTTSSATVSFPCTIGNTGRCDGTGAQECVHLSKSREGAATVGVKHRSVHLGKA